MRRVAIGFTHPNPVQDRLHREVVNALNDLAGIEVEITTGPADTRFAIRHPALGHVPHEANVIMATVPGSLYAADLPQWTNAVSFWKYTGANARLTIRVR